VAAIVKYSDLLSEILPVLSADPSDPVTEHALKRSVIRFCNESWVWKYFPDPSDLVAYENAIDIEAPAGADVSVVMTVSVNGVKIDPRRPDWLDDEMPSWQTKTGTPKYWTQTDTDQIILAPLPDVSIVNGVTMTLALQPNQKQVGFPAWIASQYLYNIVDGAIAHLMLMPDKAWTNLALGASYMERFEDGIAKARGDGVAGISRAPTRTTPQH